MTYISFVKVKKFGEDQLNNFGDIQQKTLGGVILPFPSPNWVKSPGNKVLIGSDVGNADKNKYDKFQFWSSQADIYYRN